MKSLLLISAVIESAGGQDGVRERERADVEDAKIQKYHYPAESLSGK